MKFFNMSFLFSLLLFFSACDKNLDKIDLATGGTSTVYTYDWNKIADTSTTALLSGYWNAGGQYFVANNQGSSTFNYWPQAHALDVLVDAYLRTQSSTYTGYMDQWYTGVQAKNGGSFLGQFYDDEGWNALAMLRAYDVTKDSKWKDAAEAVWADIQTGWNSTMGGGIAWQKQQLYYKNTPANGPACILAARLYERFGNPSDLAWAQKIYTWWKSTLVDAGSGFVYDGINSGGDGKLNTTYRFTYNQGLFIGAGVELAAATQQASYLSNALQTATNVLSDPTLNSAGVLKDEGQGDGGLFKGILVRYMVQLVLAKGIDAGDQQKFVVFLKNNAQLLWLKGTTRPGYFYGNNWTAAPTGGTDLTTEESGAMLMEGMALLKKNGLL
jgi:predicted alpha-1,6-mannanase (GH76 family)